jgi:hypothetical protein
MISSLAEAKKLEDGNGKQLKFEIDERFLNNPTSGALPSYYYQDNEGKKVYTLSIESPYNLVTLRVGDMTAVTNQ